MDNICRFPKTGNLSDRLSILNFVFERTADFPPKYLTPANYAMNVVVSGSGILHTPCGDYPVSENNVFLTFSAKPYFIENTGNLGYIYVSFIGPRAEGLTKRAGFTADSPVLACPEKLTGRWKEDFGAADDSCIDLVAESLLLYTISLFCRDATERHDGGCEDGILKRKQFVDLNSQRALRLQPEICVGGVRAPRAGELLGLSARLAPLTREEAARRRDVQCTRGVLGVRVLGRALFFEGVQEELRRVAEGVYEEEAGMTRPPRGLPAVVL